MGKKAVRVGFSEVMGIGSLCLSSVSTGVSKGKGRYMFNSMGMCGDP